MKPHVGAIAIAAPILVTLVAVGPALAQKAGGILRMYNPDSQTFRESWIGGTGVARNDPRVNLLYADLTGLPPIMVYYGAYEMLAGEAIEFAKRAKHVGVDVSLHSLPEGQHNFILGAGRVPEVDQAIEEIAGWLRSKLGLAALAAA
jgi:epsilon-lactone hydrolase